MCDVPPMGALAFYSGLLRPRLCVSIRLKSVGSTRADLSCEVGWGKDVGSHTAELTGHIAPHPRWSAIRGHGGEQRKIRNMITCTAGLFAISQACLTTPPPPPPSRGSLFCLRHWSGDASQRTVWGLEEAEKTALVLGFPGRRSRRARAEDN